MDTIKRRTFLQRMAIVSGGLLLAGNDLLASLANDKVKLKGRVRSGSKGIAGVVISDGYSVVATDSKGKYEFEIHPNSRAVFVSTPAGYEFLQKESIARHYEFVGTDGTKKVIDFDLTPLKQNDDEHDFIIWADPQVKNASDVEKMMTQSVPDVRKWVDGMGDKALLHGITVGDIVWDEHKLYPDYDKAVAKMNIPFFQCLGNHDMDYNKGGDETSDATFTQTYGPTYYSFNRGQVHYVVMDNVRYLGKDREYDGYFQQHQLDWLQKDLAFVGKEKLVVLCVHIPVYSGTKNNEALYSLLGDRNVHIMSGHTHYHNNVIRGNIYEHNHGTVCGAWWTGPICGDGTPCGYGVYKAKGNQLSWHYQSTGESADHQLKIFSSTGTDQSKAIKVNIWNHDPAWKTEYWVDGTNMGALEQSTDFDPLAYATLLGPELPKPRGFAEPRKTEHLFKATLPATAKEIKVIATDRFGKKFTATHNV